MQQSRSWRLRLPTHCWRRPGHDRRRWLTKPLLMPVLMMGRDRPAQRALALGGAGDVALLGSGETAFTAGLACFLAGHVAWIIALRQRPGGGRLRDRPVLAAPHVAAFGALNAYLWKRTGKDRLPVVAYSAALLAMSLTALDSGSPRTAAGGVLFLASDTLLALEKFGGLHLPAHEALVMATYASAQALLAGCTPGRRPARPAGGRYAGPGAAPDRGLAASPSRRCPIAANRSWAASSWPAIMSLTSASSGVSGRRMSSRSSGTSGPYLRASLGSFGPVVWIKPTALSVKSDALITRAHGLASRLARTCSRYCSCSSRPGSQAGLVTAATSPAVRSPNRPASTASAAGRPPGAMPAAWSSTASCSSAAHATSGSVTR